MFFAIFRYDEKLKTFEFQDCGFCVFQYVRLAYNTPQDVLQKLLESKYEILKSTSRALRIHCIDRSSWPKDVEMPTYNPQDPAWKFDKEIIIKKIRKDLCYICRKTGDYYKYWHF